MTTAPALKWWQWSTVRRRLEVWTKALLRGRRYRVALDPKATDSGFCDPDRGRIVVNPEAFGEDDAQQWQATRGLLAHEAGHALFTDAWPEGEDRGLLRTLANYLEDARVERGIARLYPGVARDVCVLGDLAWEQFKAEVAGNPLDGRQKLVAACLAWRWASDREGHAGLVETLGLGEDEEQQWVGEIRPLVERAWSAPATQEVIEIGRQILELLGLPEGWNLPNWLVVLLPNDLPHERAGVPVRLPEGGGLPVFLPGEDNDSGAGPPLPDGGDEPPLSWEERRKADCGGPARIPPAPYLDLEMRAAPLAQALVAELQPPQPDRRPLPYQWRGRYSFRQEVHDPERPFLLGQAAAPSPSGLAIQLLVDRSGSMRHRMDGVKLAVMAFHLACRDLSIPLSITAFGGGNHTDDWRDPLNVVTVQEFDGCGEVPKARIAGLWGHTGAEHLVLALRERGPILAARPEPLKLLVVIHDGDPVYQHYPDGDDWSLSLAWLKASPRRGITPIGLFLVDGEDDAYVQEEIEKMRVLFRWLIVCRADELPAKLGNLLRCFVG